MRQYARITAAGALLALGLSLAACTEDASDANVAAENIATAADNFEINRRIVFYNGITDTYILEVEGFCSVEKDAAKNQLSVTCKVGKGYKKNILGVSDNVTWFAEQLESANVSVSHYRVNFKPSVIIPNVVPN